MQCASCHGALGEGGTAPALNGWTKPRDILVAVIDERMPLGNPDLCRGDCAERVADYILEELQGPLPECEGGVPSLRRLRLLTRREYRHTVADLLDAPAPVCMAIGDCQLETQSCEAGLCVADACELHTFVLDLPDRTPGASGGGRDLQRLGADRRPRGLAAATSPRQPTLVRQTTPAQRPTRLQVRLGRPRVAGRSQQPEHRARRPRRRELAVDAKLRRRGARHPRRRSDPSFPGRVPTRRLLLRRPRGLGGGQPGARRRIPERRSSFCRTSGHPERPRQLPRSSLRSELHPQLWIPGLQAPPQRAGGAAVSGLDRRRSGRRDPHLDRGAAQLAQLPLSQRVGHRRWRLVPAR
jgi:hypothetical protein